jgi:hypothetical protein
MASASFVSIEVDNKTLDEVKFMLATVKNGARDAIRLAANQTAVTARSEIAKTVASRIQLTQTRIKKDTHIQKAKFGATSAQVIIFKKLIPLVDFPHTVRLRGGISVGIRKGRARELFRHQFKATMRSGHVGIFERRMLPSGRIARRLPIDEGFGPHIGEVFHANDEQRVFSEMMALFQKNLIQKAEFLLKKA